MTTISVTPQSLRVEFTRTEKWTGFLRDLDVDRRDIASVKAVPDGLAAAHGLRAPGLGIPGVRKIGNWWRTGGRHTLVSVRRGQPALSIELVGGRRSLLLGSPDAQALADALASPAAEASNGK